MRDFTCYNTETQSEVVISLCQDVYGDYTPQTVRQCGFGPCSAPLYIWTASEYGEVMYGIVLMCIYML